MPDELTLNPDALVETEDVRSYIQIGTNEKPGDEWFIRVINGISAEIQNRTGHFYRPRSDAAETKVFGHDGGRYLTIADCTDVELVETSTTPNDEDTFNALDDNDWIVEPLDQDIKVTLRFSSELEVSASNIGWGGLGLHVDPSRTPWPREMQAQAQAFIAVRITAVWGHAEVPANVKLACMMWVQSLFKRDAALMSADLAEVVINQGIPDDVAAILDGQTENLASLGAV